MRHASLLANPAASFPRRSAPASPEAGVEIDVSDFLHLDASDEAKEMLFRYRRTAEIFRDEHQAQIFMCEVARQQSKEKDEEVRRRINWVPM